MEQEGYYQLKPACYNSETVNPDSKICLSGSPWVTNVAHNMMADDTHFKDPQVKMINHDEFHRAKTLYPFHHPSINSTCEFGESCTFETYSITENWYSKQNDFDELKKFQVAASE